MIITSIVALLSTGAVQTEAARSAPKPVRSATTLIAWGTFSDGATRIFDVTAGDLDGDGAPDAMELHVMCDGPNVSSATVLRSHAGQAHWGNRTEANSRVTSPRDAASGLATGKRQHRPLTMSVSDPTSMKNKPLASTYDLKTSKGARMIGTAPTKVSLSDISPAVCGPH